MAMAMSGIRDIYDITSEQALLSLSVSCVFLNVDCWFIAFENVDCKVMWEYTFVLLQKASS
jgi:hypothetical protein